MLVIDVAYIPLLETIRECTRIQFFIPRFSILAASS